MSNIVFRIEQQNSGLNSKIHKLKDAKTIVDNDEETDYSMKDNHEDKEINNFYSSC